MTHTTKDSPAGNQVQVIYLVRHGQCLTNVGKPMTRADDEPGKPDADVLTELGQKQAKAAGVELRRIGVDKPVIIPSGKTRSIETATIIGNELNGSNLRDSDIRLNEFPQSIEAYPQLLEDLDAFFDELHANTSTAGRPIVVVAHCHLLEVFLYHKLQAPFRLVDKGVPGMANLTFHENCGISILRNGSFETWNSVSHLENLN